MDWDEYFVVLTMVISKKSKDPHTQVGAIIVNRDNRIVSTGYNGFPKTCQDNNDQIYSWDKDIKKLFVVHAEENCILNGSGDSHNDSTMYCTLFPCNKCAQSIVQTGIKTLVYVDEKVESDVFRASRTILKNAGVNVIRYKKKEKNILLTY